MKKIIITLIVTAIYPSLCNQRGEAADLISRCSYDNYTYTRSSSQDDKKNTFITVKSDNVKEYNDSNATFVGNVDMNHGDSHLQADEIQLYQDQLEGIVNPTRTVCALGNVHYYDNQIILKGSKGWMNLDTKDINIWEGYYQMVDHQGYGKADLMKQREDNRYTILENGSFTSCSPGSDAWSIIGSEVIYDRKRQIMEIWNARFKLGKIPVFYSPYLQLPVGNKRRSGFLTPNIKYSTSNYFEFCLPYYWNIAPNMDDTITPHYIYKHGNIMWENEFRYLTSISTGLIGSSYLSSDKSSKIGKLPSEEDNHHRWLLYWRHAGVIDQVWRFNVDYTKTSDLAYFDDFDSKYGSNVDDYITQNFCIGYSSQNFDAAISTKQFQVFNQYLHSNNYAVKPQLDINWYQSNLGPFDLHIYGQAVHFVDDNLSVSNGYSTPETTRLHLESSLTIPWNNDWANINAEAKFIATHYQQKNIDKYNKQHNSNLEGYVNRILPKFKIDDKLILERNMNLLDGYTQTLESHIQYLYVPYRDQSKIWNYDSSFLQSDDCNLFRDRTYSGLDRISSANQITTSIVTRIYDESSVERFNVTVGQIYHLTESRIDSNSHVDREKDNNTDSLVWIGDAYWHMIDHWGLRGDLQYDKLNNIVASNSTVEYFHDENRIIQLNYRYTNPIYIQTILPNCMNNHHADGISQIGAIANWQITDRWSVLGAYHFDTHENNPAGQMLELQYNYCCYAIHLSYKRKLNGHNTENSQSNYNTIINFSVELRGMSSNYDFGHERTTRLNMLI